MVEMNPGQTSGVLKSKASLLLSLNILISVSPQYLCDSANIFEHLLHAEFCIKC